MSTPPAWLEKLANAVLAQISLHDSCTPWWCHYHLDEWGWEITVFPARGEMLGGPYDGQTFSPRFSLDVQALLELFDSVQTVSWQAHRLGHGDEVGTHLAVQGMYAGEAIWLRIPASAPARFPVKQYAWDNRLSKDLV